MATDFKVVSTGDLRRAADVARCHDFMMVLSDVMLSHLDERGPHVVGRIDVDHGDRVRNGVPYYRVRALLALRDRDEPVERVVDVPPRCGTAGSTVRPSSSGSRRCCASSAVPVRT